MKWLLNMLLASLAVLVPVKAALIVVGILVFSDLILGVIAARKRGELISSAGFRRTITKLFVYEVAIILGFLTETYLMGPFVPVVKIITAFIGITELKSIME